VPAKTPESVRAKVVWLWLMDVAQQEIANKTGISLGTVRNIIGELRGGRFSLYTEYLDWLDDMRWVSHILKRENRSLKEVVVGWSAVEALRELGIDPSELLLIVQLFRRLCGPGFPVEGFVAAALRIADLEKTTKLDFDELEEQAKCRQAEIDMKEKTVRELTEIVESIRAAKAKEESELQQLRVLRERELESTEVNVKTRLSQIQQELHSNYLRAELVETFFGILHNPAMVGDFRLAAMKEKLSQVLKARQGMQGFPINYDRMRDEMIFLVQTVLGSFLVPRQTVDEEIGRLRNELTDLKLDRLGKLEKDRISFNKEKDEFIRFEHEFATFATAILCKMAVGMVKQGKIGLMICDKCRLVFACPEFRRTGYASRSGCPRCYGSSRQLSTAVLERRLKERESIESC